MSSPVVSVLDSGSDGLGSSPGWGMTLCPSARRITHIASSSRIGRKTVGPVSYRVGVGDVNFPHTRLLCGGLRNLETDSSI